MALSLPAGVAEAVCVTEAAGAAPRQRASRSAGQCGRLASAAARTTIAATRPMTKAPTTPRPRRTVTTGAMGGGADGRGLAAVGLGADEVRRGRTEEREGGAGAGGG